MATRSFLPRVVLAAALATALIVDSGPVLALAPTAIAPTALAPTGADVVASSDTKGRSARPTPVDSGAAAAELVARRSIARAPAVQSLFSRAAARQLARESRREAQAAPKAAPRKHSPVGQTSYRGRNHLWIPALGISRSTVYFSCSSSGVGNYVYRWGCAGRNNVYLFGHAYSVFRSLHDAYVGHRLYRGLKAIYADGSGHVRTYRVSFWKVVSPTNGAWAYAGQSRPSMTLQTCVGSRSQYRLIVRLLVG